MIERRLTDGAWHVRAVLPSASHLAPGGSPTHRHSSFSARSKHAPTDRQRLVYGRYHRPAKSSGPCTTCPGRRTRRPRAPPDAAIACRDAEQAREINGDCRGGTAGADMFGKSQWEGSHPAGFPVLRLYVERACCVPHPLPGSAPRRSCSPATSADRPAAAPAWRRFAGWSLRTVVVLMDSTPFPASAKAGRFSSGARSASSPGRCRSPQPPLNSIRQPAGRALPTPLAAVGRRQGPAGGLADRVQGRLGAPAPAR